MLKLHLIFALTLVTGIGIASCRVNQYSYQVLTPLEEESVSVVIDDENFLKDSLISKDGWKLTFHHIYVKVSNVRAAKSPHLSEYTAHPENTITFIEVPKTIDLISQEISTLQSSLHKTDRVVINGLASKGNKTIEFTLRFNHDSNYICDRLSDVNNASISAGQQLEEIQTSLNFDRLFGNGNLPASASINQEAIGFQPLANLAHNHHLDLNETGLKNYLSAKYYKALPKSFSNVSEMAGNKCNLVNE